MTEIRETVKFTTSDINKSDKWEKISEYLFRAQSIRANAEEIRKKYIQMREDFGATKALRAKIAETDNDIEFLNDLIDACELRLSEIGHKMSDWEINYATARDCHLSKNYQRKFVGDGKKDMDATIKNITGILSELTGRIVPKNSDERESWSENNGDYMELLTKGEYKRLKNAISHFCYNLYGENYKVKSEHVAFLLFACIKSDRVKGVKVCGSKTMRNTLVNIANIFMFPPENNDKKADKTTANSKKSNTTK